MGRGKIDFFGIVTYLNETEYDQWIIIEEETELAQKNPDKVSVQNGDYLQNSFLEITDS